MLRFYLKAVPVYASGSTDRTMSTHADAESLRNRRFTTAAAAAFSAPRAPEAGRRSPFCSLRQAVSFYVRATSNPCGAVVLTRGEERAWVHSHSKLQPLQRVPHKARPPARLASRCFSSLLSVCVQPQASCGAAAMVRGEKRAWCAVTSQLPRPLLRFAQQRRRAVTSPNPCGARQQQLTPTVSYPTKQCVAKSTRGRRPWA